MLQSIDNDGTWEGYDYEVTGQILDSVDIPVIACGGCGNVEHLKQVLYQTNAQATAIGSMAVYSKKRNGSIDKLP